MPARPRCRHWRGRPGQGGWFLAFLRGLEPHAGLLSAQQGDGLGNHVAAPQVDKARTAEGRTQQAQVRASILRVKGSEVRGDLVRRSPHDPRGEDAVRRPARGDRRAKAVRTAEAAVVRPGNPPSGRPLSLVLPPEVGLRMARDPRGIQQPAQQGTSRPRGGADQVVSETVQLARTTRRFCDPPDGDQAVEDVDDELGRGASLRTRLVSRRSAPCAYQVTDAQRWLGPPVSRCLR